MAEQKQDDLSLKEQLRVKLYDWTESDDVVHEIEELLLPLITSRLQKAELKGRIDERIQVKDKMLKYFRKELTMFRSELKNAQGLNPTELQVVKMLLNRIDARYAVLRLMNHDRIAQLRSQQERKQ